MVATILPASTATTLATTGSPFLGIGVRDPNTTTITTLYFESTAAQLGMQLGDSLISINGITVNNLQEIRGALSGLSIGDPTSVTVRRGANSVVLGPLPIGARN